MITFLILAVVILVTLLIKAYLHTKYAFTSEALLLIDGLCTFILIFSIVNTFIIIPLSRLHCRNRIVGFKETRATVVRARHKDRSLENAAMIHKIVEQNSWLKSSQYWNTTVFDGFILDEVNELEPIE